MLGKLAEDITELVESISEKKQRWILGTLILLS
jgi:hypothetical protein